MRILLLDPPGKNKGLNTGLAYLSAVLAENHDVSVLDLNNIEPGLCGDPNPDMESDQLEKRIIHAVKEFEPHLFGVSVKTFTADISEHIFQLVKQQRPEIVTVAGGPHITLDGFDFIKNNQIDYGVEGEGEYTLPELCEALENGRNVQSIEGVFCWNSGQLIHNPKAGMIKDLDALPLPDYSAFSSVIANHGSLDEYPMLTSRGCPYQCAYCSMPKIMGGKWRAHTSERVITELKQAKAKYRNTRFTVVDDNFTLNLKRVETICDAIISENINLPWSSQNGIRADRINGSLAARMERAGCKYVWIGVESADENVFDKLNKGEKLANIKNGIRHLKNAGIQVGGFFIVGLPHSTREADLKSVEFVKDLGIDGWWFNFVPYPHTEAWEWVQTHARILRPVEGALQYGADTPEPVFETVEYSKESRMKTYEDIHIRMNYFDRLADPSLKQRYKWPQVFKKISPYGFTKLLSLLFFIASYNVRLVKNKFAGNLWKRSD